jgi:hypothetical protein
MVAWHWKTPARDFVGLVGMTLIGFALLLLVLASAPAIAAPGHPVAGISSTGAGTSPHAVAVDAAGNFYVFDPNRNGLAKFDPSGNPLDFAAAVSYVGGNELLGTPAGPFAPHNPSQHFGVAVDDSGGPNDGDIYLTLEGDTAAAFVYDASGSYLGKLGSAACGVAVNQANGAVYVTNGGSVVDYGVPSGDLASTVPLGTLAVRTDCNLAVDATGAAYVAPASGPVGKYDASQFGTASPIPAVAFEPGDFSNRAVAVDPVDGSLYVDKGSQILKRDAAGTQQGQAFGQLSESGGMAVDAGRDVWVTDSGGGIFVFGPDEVQLPAGSTGGSSGVTATSAAVEGSVDPDGAGGVTGCEFRFGEDTGYADGAVPCTPAASSGSPIIAPTAVSANLTGLISGMAYHYRLFVTNANGTQMSTGDQTLTTPAATEGVSTGAATNVENDSAELNGSYVGDGQDVHYFFEWGRTTAYGHTTPAPPGGDAGTDAGSQSVAPIGISGLKAKTAYHYRLVISTASGITRGADEVVTTAEPVANLSADPATAIRDTSAELNGSFDGDPNYETHYYFEWGATNKYGNVTPAPPGTAVGPSSGRVAVAPAAIAGLRGGSVYHFRIVASNATGTSVSPDQSLRTAEPPTVGSLISRKVLAESAELVGEVNPNRGHTTYRFEWGPTTAYGNFSPVPAGDAGSGATAVQVSTALTGLVPGATYHFRLVASNEYGTTASGDQSFGFYPSACPNAQLRQETRSDRLPDCRAYELVTPGFAQGTFIQPATGPEAPLANGRLAYGGFFGTFPEDAGDPSNVLADLYVSTRTDSGWFQKFIGRPATETLLMGGPPGPVVEQMLQFATPLSRLFVGTQVSADLSRLVSYDHGWPSNPYGQLGSPSNAPYVWDTSTGRLLERWPTNLAAVPHGEDFVGFPMASANFNHFVFASNIPFAPGGTFSEREIACCPTFSAADPNAFPAELPAPIYDNNLETGEVELASRKSGNVNTYEGFVLHVSANGTRILMSEQKPSTPGPTPPREELRDIKGPLYLRVDGERTFEIAAGRQITYVDSTEDGRMIYLTSKEQLTPDDHDSSTDLFVWDESEPGKLTRVSAGPVGNAGNSDECEAGWSGGGCSVQMVEFLPYAGRRGSGIPGAFVAGQGGNGRSDTMIASKSGDAYFLSPEQLIGGKGETGQANLYLERDGTLRFVTSLNPAPVCSEIHLRFPQSSCAAGPIARMQVTPDGAHMAFVASSNVTGYDSAGHTEMYTYDPESGRLACASCRLDGQAPTGEVLGSLNGLFQAYDGRVFFTTLDALVGRDTDGVEDVYEYTEGQPQLISLGLGAGFGSFSFGEAQFAGLISVSANGTDVYFSTTDSLVTQDHNGADLKIYDARTGGGFPADRTPGDCVAADECHGPGAASPPPLADRTGVYLGSGQAKAHKAKKGKKKPHKRGKKKTHRKGKKAKGDKGGKSRG